MRPGPDPSAGEAALFSLRMRAEKDGRHISGAEGLYAMEEALATVARYARRAAGHARGRPDRITLTIERVDRPPLEIGTLPLRTLTVADEDAAQRTVRRLLAALGVSGAGIRAALAVVAGPRPMRGAALMDTEGIRLDPDLERGVRVSRIGIAPEARRLLGRRLSRRGINTETVREALVLASKVQEHPAVLAELCVSDDPDYTTGYVASRRFGYLRIPRIKKAGSARGGRVFFVSGGDRAALLDYLEVCPVLVRRVAPCGGETELSKLLPPEDP